MPGEVEVAGSEVADPVAPLGTPPAGSAPEAPPAADPAAPNPAAARAEPKNVVVPTSAMRRIKDESYAAGQQAALDSLAQASGYANHQELAQALAKLKGQPAAQPAAAAAQPAPAAQPDPSLDPAAQLGADKEARRTEGRYQRQIEAALNDRNKFAQSAKEWQGKAREYQAEVDAVRAEMHLRTIASGAGVQDIDYAITLFSREVERLTPEQAATFDEKQFFEGLRKSKPLLFGESVVPANTGTGAGGAPTPPKPGAVAARNGQEGKFDARKANPRDLAAELARRGINAHGH
jgi:hypothetical protein